MADIIVTLAGTAGCNGTYIDQGPNSYAPGTHWWLRSDATFSLNVNPGDGIPQRWYFCLGNTGGSISGGPGYYHTPNGQGTDPVAANWAAGAPDGGTLPMPSLAYAPPTPAKPSAPTLNAATSTRLKLNIPALQDPSDTLALWGCLQAVRPLWLPT